MPLQIVKTERGTIRLEFRTAPEDRVKVSRHNALMIALNALADMRTENPRVVKNPHWRMAADGIAKLIKGGV